MQATRVSISDARSGSRWASSLLPAAGSAVETRHRRLLNSPKPLRCPEVLHNEMSHLKILDDHHLHMIAANSSKGSASGYTSLCIPPLSLCYPRYPLSYMQRDVRPHPSKPSIAEEGGGAHLEITSSNIPLRGSSIHNPRLQNVIQRYTGQHTATSR